MTKQQLIADVRNAWKSELSKEVEDSLVAYTPHPEEVEARELFRGLQWTEVPDETLELNFPNLLLLGSTALRYYLPAFITCVLRKNGWSELQERLVDGLFRVPKKEAPLQLFRAKFDPLTYSQKRAVADFLRYIAERYDLDSRFRKRVTDSITRYWG